MRQKEKIFMIYTMMFFIFACTCFLLGFWFYIEVPFWFCIVYMIMECIHISIILFVKNKKIRIMSVFMLIPVLAFPLGMFAFTIISAIIYLIVFIILDDRIKYKALLQYIIIIPMVFIISVLLYDSSYKSTIVKQEIVSPNRKHVVQLIEFQGGSMDKHQAVDVLPNRILRFGFIKFVPHKTNFTHEGPNVNMIIYWESDLAVNINGEIYEIGRGMVSPT